MNLIVTSLSGTDGGLTLDAAIAAANEYSGDEEVVITFAPKLSGRTIKAEYTELTRDVTISDDTKQGVTLDCMLRCSGCELTLENVRFGGKYDGGSMLDLSEGASLVSKNSSINTAVGVDATCQVSGSIQFGEHGGIALREWNAETIAPLWDTVLADVDAASLKNARIILNTWGPGDSDEPFELTAPPAGTKFSTCKYCAEGCFFPANLILPENGTLYVGEDCEIYLNYGARLICEDGSKILRESSLEEDEAILRVHEGSYIQVNGDVHFGVPVSAQGRGSLQGDGTYHFDAPNALTLVMPEEKSEDEDRVDTEYNEAWANPTTYFPTLLPTNYTTCKGAYISYATSSDALATHSFMYGTITDSLLKQLTPTGFDHCCFVDISVADELTLEANTKMRVSSKILVNKGATFTCGAGSVIYGVMDANTWGLAPNAWFDGDDDDRSWSTVENERPTCYVTGTMELNGTIVGTTLALMDGGEVTGSCTLDSDFALMRALRNWDGSTAGLWSGVDGLTYTTGKSAYCAIDIDGLRNNTLTINNELLQSCCAKGTTETRITCLTVHDEQTVTVAVNTVLKADSIFVSGGKLVVQKGTRLQGWQAGYGDRTNGTIIDCSDGDLVFNGVDMPGADVGILGGSLTMTGCSGVVNIDAYIGGAEQTLKITGCDLSKLESMTIRADADEDFCANIDLSGNYWGTTDKAVILSKISASGWDVELGDILAKPPFASFDTTAPSGLESKVQGKNAILTWDAAPGAKSYIVKFTNSKGKTTSKTVKTNSLTTALADGEYTWSVQAVSAKGEKSAESESGAFGLDLTAPSKITGLTATTFNRDGADYLQLSWDASADDRPGDVTYIVGYSAQKNFASGSSATGLEACGDTNLLGDLSVGPGALLYYRVCAVDEAGNASAWTTGSFGIPLRVPGHLQEAAISGKYATLAWDTVEGAASYTVKITDTKGKTTTKTVKTDSLKIALADGEYTWSVQAVSAAKIKSEEVEGEGFLVDITAPAKVTGAAAAGLDGNQVQLTWAASTDNHAGEVLYEVEYSAMSNFAKGTVTACTVDTTQATLPATPGQYLYYRIRAVDAHGNATAWTTGKYGAPLPDPAVLKDATVAGKSVTLEWDAVEGAVSYAVNLTNAKGKTTTKTVKTNSLKISLAEGVYTWSVQAVSAAKIKSEGTAGEAFLVDHAMPLYVEYPTYSEGSLDCCTAVADAALGVPGADYTPEASAAGTVGIDRELALSAGTYYAPVAATPGMADACTLDLELQTAAPRQQAMLASPIS